MKRKVWHWHERTLCLFCCGAAAISRLAMAEEIVPEDTCVVELQLPVGATVAVDGKDYGHPPQLTFEHLDPRQTYPSRFTVRFKDNGEEQHTVLVRGGQRVRLAATPPGTARPELVLQTGHTREVTSVSFSPDGRQVLTGSHDGTAILWDAATGQKLRTFQVDPVGVSSVAFSPDGRQVLAGSYGNKTAILWNATTGQNLRVFQGHTHIVNSVTFSPDGGQVLTGSADKTAILWDAVTGQKLRTFQGHGTAVGEASFSPDSGRVLTGSSDNTAILWDTATSQKLRAFQGHTSGVVSVTFSPDGRQVLTGSWDKTAILWDAATGQKLRTFQGHTGWVHSVTFSPDGRQVLTGSEDKTAILWDAATGQRLRTLQGHTDSVRSVTFSPDGRQVLTGSDDKTAVLWDAATGQKLRTFTGNTNWVSSASFGPDGRQVLTGSWDHTAILWEAVTGQRLRTFQGHTNRVCSVTFSPDGRQVLTGSGDKTAILWEAATGQKLRTFQGHTGWVLSVTFSPDGRQVLTGSGDNTAILWEAATGQKLRTFEGHTQTVNWVTFSPDGWRVLTGSFDKTAILWDAATGQKLHTFQGHTWWVTSVAFSPDGRQVLTGSGDKTAILWDAATGQRLRTLQGHTGWVGSVSFSPDGRQVLTDSSFTAILWDAATGQKLRTFQGHTGAVSSASFGPDGRQVLTGSGDGTARLWDVATGQELARLISLDAGNDWLVVTPEGLFDGSEGGRQKVSYRVANALRPTPVDRFFQDFYRPGLLRAIFQGERPMPELELGRHQPPLVRVVSPAQDGGVEAGRVTIEVEAVDQGGGVQGPWLFQNGARVLAPGTTQREGNTVRRSYQVALVEGINRLELKAASGDGSWESEPAVRVLRYDRPLEKPVLHVVAVGIARYAEGSYKLKYCRSDAEALVALFRRRGPTLYSELDVTTLFDEQATRERIRQSMQTVAQSAKPQDTLVLFLSGHGAMVGQRYYFIPYDFRTHADKTRSDDVREQGLPADALGDFLSAGLALKRILILDTCGSGGVTDLFRVAARDPFAFRGEIERLSRSRGVHVIAASASSEAAQEVDALQHGVLSYALLAGLKAVDRGPLERVSVQTSNPSEVVDVLEWFSFASGHVPRLTKQFCGEEQSVHTAGSGTSFPVLPLKDR